MKKRFFDVFLFAEKNGRNAEENARFLFKNRAWGRFLQEQIDCHASKVSEQSWK